MKNSAAGSRKGTNMYDVQSRNAYLKIVYRNLGFVALNVSKLLFSLSQNVFIKSGSLEIFLKTRRNFKNLFFWKRVLRLHTFVRETALIFNVITSSLLNIFTLKMHSLFSSRNKWKCIITLKKVGPRQLRPFKSRSRTNKLRSAVWRN